jgi:outer membrane protein assembly factor BamB
VFKAGIRRKRSLLGVAALIALASSVTASGALADDWTMFHHDPTHTGVSTDGTISTNNISTVGLDWAANTGSASYTSPVVAHSTSLNKDLVYAANQVGAINAYDVSSGDRQWVLQLSASIQSSPAIVNNVLYFGANDHKMYAVNASTGTTICSYTTPGNISSSPTVVDPNGSGLVIYFGENGITGADDGGDEFAVNAVDPNAATDCSLKWTKSITGDYGGANLAGSWSPPAFATDVNGRALIVFGGSSPDCAVYAVDALTGALVWRFQTQIFAQDNDVGAGPTITAPGVNGFVDGVVYVAGKDKILYALNLRTGAKIWQFSIRADSSTVGGATRSTAAYYNGAIYIGYGAGVYSINAVTGLKNWKSQDFGLTTQEVISSPAITGPVVSGGGRTLWVGDMSGKLFGFGTTGSKLFQYATGSFIYGSPAIADGHVFITSSDGFLYAFALGGAIGPKPDTTIASPADGANLPNTGTVNVTGSATDNTSVAKVLVAIKNKNSGAWWDSSLQKWSKTYQENLASLTNPGGASTNWSTSFPVPFDGGPFLIQASAVDGGGQHDPTPDTHSVLVAANGFPPDTTITSPVFRQVFHPPLNAATGLFYVPYYIQVSGTATDSGGAHPGIAKVLISVRNIEHAEYNCGPATVSAPEGCWQPTSTSRLATLASPGATSTNWTFQFPIYDHPHKYRIVAWAVDKDNEADPTRFVVGRICVRNPGDNTCA